ncbi:F-box protein At3g07870-like [Papaver somniferum]|uniref:F-box protein At3g07870-like n=1 Tax=Papaver somniferum TaxID=3469 RepID=UPI000E700408|nr:F-box protein At3g07870-like [Papaver somniferum]
MEKLPEDITEDIFSRLPVEPTLLRCKRECKTWRELHKKYKSGVLFAYESEGKIQLYYGDQDEVTLEAYYSNKTLTKHVEYSSDDDNYMVGSCNGLVCLRSGICNPVTREFLRFLDRKTPVFSGQLQGIGFGYLPSTNEYKVVRTAQLGPQTGGGRDRDVFIHRENIIDIWAFKRNAIRIWPQRGKYYDDNWSWTRDFRLPTMLLSSPFAIVKSNEILTQGHQQKLYCYNANTSTITKSWDGGEKGTSCLRAVPHINTLVSLKELGMLCYLW